MENLFLFIMPVYVFAIILTDDYCIKNINQPIANENFVNKLVFILLFQIIFCIAHEHCSISTFLKCNFLLKNNSAAKPCDLLIIH